MSKVGYHWPGFQHLPGGGHREGRLLQAGQGQGRRYFPGNKWDICLSLSAMGGFLDQYFKVLLEGVKQFF